MATKKPWNPYPGQTSQQLQDAFKYVTGGITNWGNQMNSQSLVPSAPGVFAPTWAPRAGGGGGNPYSGLINDYINQLSANSSAQSSADAASRDAAIRRFLISYGAVPDFDSLGISGSAKGFLQGAVNDQVRQLAQKNTDEGLSVKARLEHANTLAQRRIPAQLAARGLLRSGQTGSYLGEQALSYKQQGFDTLNEMLSNIEGTVGNFLAAERERQNALAMARMQAAMAAMGDWGGGYMSDFGGGFAQPVTQTMNKARPPTRPAPSPYKYRFPTATKLGQGRPF